MSHEKGWLNVADGSSLYVDVTGAQVLTRLCGEDGHSVPCSNPPQLLRSPTRYIWIYVVEKALGPGRVEAWIEKPGGAQHGKRLVCDLAGAAGATTILELRAVTKAGGGQ